MTTVSFQLPGSVERQLRQNFGNLDAAAKEAALLEIYRQGQLSHGGLRKGQGYCATRTMPYSSGITSPRTCCRVRNSISS